MSADHWNKLDSWRYNKLKDKWETPEEVTMATNIINDPTGDIMQAYLEEQRAELPIEITVPTQEETADGKDSKVQVLQHKVDLTENREFTIRQLDEQDNLTEKARSVAYSIKSYSSFMNDDDDDDDSQISTISELARRKAAKMVRAERDYELDSVVDANDKNKEVHNILRKDNLSHASSLTDITNNTNNKIYYTGVDNASTGSIGSSLSIKSLKESDLQDVITEDMTTEEIESNIQHLVLLQNKRNKERALGLIEKAKQLQQQKLLLQDNNSLNPQSDDTAEESSELV